MEGETKERRITNKTSYTKEEKGQENRWRKGT